MTAYYNRLSGCGQISDVKNALAVLDATERLLKAENASDKALEAAWNTYLDTVQNRLAPDSGNGPG